MTRPFSDLRREREEGDEGKIHKPTVWLLGYLLEEAKYIGKNGQQNFCEKRVVLIGGYTLEDREESHDTVHDFGTVWTTRLVPTDGLSQADEIHESAEVIKEKGHLLRTPEGANWFQD